MANILLVIHVLAAIAIVVLVLLQQGRGADMGAAFGGGSQTLFGARGSATFLSRVTTWLAALFFLTSLGLAYMYAGVTQSRSVTEDVVPQTQPDLGRERDIPAVPQAPDQGAEGDVPSAPQPAGSPAPETGSTGPVAPKPE